MYVMSWTWIKHIGDSYPKKSLWNTIFQTASALMGMGSTFHATNMPNAKHMKFLVGFAKCMLAKMWVPFGPAWVILHLQHDLKTKVKSCRWSVESINQFSIRRLGCRYTKIMFQVGSGTPVSFTPFGVNLFVWIEEKCSGFKKIKTFFWGHFQCQNARIKVHPWLKSALLSYVGHPQFFHI
jgi:hypothetical protein